MHLWPIAKVSFKECLRFRLLYFIFGAGLLFILAGKGCSPGTIKGKGLFFDESALIGWAMGAAFHGIAFWSTLLCGLLASQVLPREIDSGTAALTMSRPLRRSTFIAGKLLAVCMVSVMNLFVLGTLFFILFFMEIGHMPVRIYAGLCVLTAGLVLFALLNMLLSLLLPRMPALMAGLLIYCTGFFCAIPAHVTRITMIWEPSATVAALHRYLPALGDVQFIASGMIHRMPAPADIAAPGLNALVYLVLCWYATTYLFSKKQL